MEARGALDDRLKGLAWLILKRIESGEDEFTLDQKDIARYYPYEHVPEFLNVAVKNLESYITKQLGSYSLATNTITLDDARVLFMRRGYKGYKSKLFEILMHELTHFVNHYESQYNEKLDSIPKPMVMKGTIFSNKVRAILYLFSKTEMNARATEFKVCYKKGNKLSDYEGITKLSYMRELIDDVKNDTQPSDDQPLSIVELLLQARGYRKMQIDGRERMLNPSPEDFEKAKEAIVKKLTKAYNDFHQKLSKIYYDKVSA
jgi:hypothetical protein